MIGDKNIAEDGSTVVGKNNYGTINNLLAKNGGVITVNNISQRTIQELPSLLSAIILEISEQSLSEYSKGNRRELPPEAIDKLRYNNISASDSFMHEYARFFLVLERAYRGVEQRNSDARFLVIRKARIAYIAELDKICTESCIPQDMRDIFERDNSTLLLRKTIDYLMRSYVTSQGRIVEEEVAHLAVSLIVADAVVDCEVLQRPKNASPA